MTCRSINVACYLYHPVFSRASMLITIKWKTLPGRSGFNVKREVDGKG